MSSISLNISLTDQQAAFIREQFAARGFSSPDDFVRWLIQQAKAQDEQSRIDAMIVEGINSTPKHELTEGFRASMHTELDERLKARRSA